MKFVLAPDSFKGCMTAKQAANAMSGGILRADPRADVKRIPMADGGEGTTEALVDALHGRWIKVNTEDPLGRSISARYGLVDHDQIAIIETSAASGIQYIDPKTTDPGQASTYGTGLLMKDAIERHVKKIILGLGGSATNDGGSGMASALGVRFLDKNGRVIQPCGNNLSELARIDVNHVLPQLKRTSIITASDVTNPLTGPHGASAVFGPQKGADLSQVKRLDGNLSHYAGIIKFDLNKDVKKASGSGAAGGLGAGLMAFTNCRIGSGIKIVMRLTGLRRQLQGADVVMTGEGSVDSQTQFGKVPVGVAELAKQVSPHCKVIALGGHVGTGIELLYKKGIDAVLPIVPGAMSLSRAIETGSDNLKKVSENLTRLLK